MKTYEVKVVEKTVRILKVMAEDRPDATERALEKIKAGDFGLEIQGTIDIMSVEEVIAY